MLEARAICRTSSAGRPLLRDVRLHVRGGDRVAVTGPTGSGKTLLLRALALLDPFDSGDVIWRGGPVADRSTPEFRASVIYLQQRPTLIDGTVEENLRTPFRFRAHRERPFERDTVHERLADLGRGEPFLAQDVAHLSGGERQIVALLRALALTPSVLLLDEPTAALDADAASRMESAIQRWLDGSSDRACVWVTHNPEQARRVGNRHARMDAGLLIESDTTAGAR